MEISKHEIRDQIQSIQTVLPVTIDNGKNSIRDQIKLFSEHNPKLKMENGKLQIRDQIWSFSASSETKNKKVD